MLRSRKRKHPPRLFAADSPLLRARFAQEARLAGGAGDIPSVSDAYGQWLRQRGIEPETGHMNEAGLAFFKTCLEERDATGPRANRGVAEVRHLPKR